MNKKWVDPLEMLLQADKNSASVEDYIEKAKNKTPNDRNNVRKEKKSTKSIGLNKNKATEQNLTKISTDLIYLWDGKDRPDNEKEGVEDLIKGFKTIGQQVPCIVRPSKKKEGFYELIAGECRWLAAKEIGVDLLVIIHDLDERMATLVQAAENENRGDLSDFAKGMSYARKIKEGKITQKDLIEVIGKTQQQVSRLLSFDRIPKKVFDQIGDFKKVSARTAEEIRRLCKKGPEYIEIILAITNKIREGSYGANKIATHVNKSVLPSTKKERKAVSRKVYSRSGRHLFSIGPDSNNRESIRFPTDVLETILIKDPELKSLEELVRKIIDGELEK